RQTDIMQSLWLPMALPVCLVPPVAPPPFDCSDAPPDWSRDLSAERKFDESEFDVYPRRDQPYERLWIVSRSGSSPLFAIGDCVTWVASFALPAVPSHMNQRVSDLPLSESGEGKSIDDGQT